MTLALSVGIDPERLAARIGGLGAAGPRLAQLIALRTDLIGPSVAAALARQRPPPADERDARERAHRALGRPLEAILPDAMLLPSHGNPLLRTFRGWSEDGDEILLRIALADAAPTAAELDLAVALAADAVGEGVARDWAVESLSSDLARWITADLDLAGQGRALRALRRESLRGGASAAARPLAVLAGRNVLAIECRAGLLPAARAGGRALAEAKLDPADGAERLFEAAIEPILRLGWVPVEPGLDRLAFTPGGRVAHVDIGALERVSIPPADLRRHARAAASGDASLIAATVDALCRPGPDPAEFRRRIAEACRDLRAAPDDRAAAAALPRLIRRIEAASRRTGTQVPPDLLAIGRWLGAAAAAAARIAPAADLGEATRHVLVRASIERLFERPRGAAAADRLLAAIDLAEALPDRIDRWMADAASDHFRLPVETRRAAGDRALRAWQVRLVSAALLWLGIAIMLLAVRDLPGPAGLGTGAAALLWTSAIANGLWFAHLWRRLP